MPEGYPIADDLNTDSAQIALSAKQGKRLKEMLTTFENIDFVNYVISGNFFISNAASDTNKWKTISGYSSALIPVSGGDVIRIAGHEENARTFYAVLTNNSHVAGETASYATGYTGLVPIALGGNTAEIVVPGDGKYLYVTISIGGDMAPSSVKKQIARLEHIAETTEEINSMLKTDRAINVQDYALSGGYFIANGDDAERNKWIVISGYSSALIPVSAGDVVRITGHAETARTFYAVLTTDAHVIGTYAAYATGYTGLVPIALGGNTDEFVVPSDGKFLYVTISIGGDMAPSQIMMFQEKFATKEDIAKYAGNQVQFPTLLRCGELTNIIFTMDDFMLAHEYDENQGIDNLKFSNDLGETWVTKANEFGIIVNAFMFADGTLMIGSKKDDGCRLYWTRDLVTYVFQEATVIDYDGNPYTPVSGTTRFYTPVLPCEHVYVDGDEVYCFWDYIISTTNARAWYAISNADGVTVRAAFAFNLSQINGVTIPARHVHFFGYNKYNGYYYILTGDHNNTECNIMRGKRNASHVWTWERIVYGQDYKLIMPAFDEGNMYAVTDYTDSYLANSKGVLMVPINEIHKDRFRYLFKATSSFMADGAINSNVGLAWYLVDNHGWRIIKTDYLGNSKILLAHNDHNYVWVDNDANIRFANMFGPNNNGDVYSRFTKVGNSVSGEAWLKWSHQKTYNFTEIMRNAGATDFFKDWHSLLY